MIGDIVGGVDSGWSKEPSTSDGEKRNANGGDRYSKLFIGCSVVAVGRLVPTGYRVQNGMEGKFGMVGRRICATEQLVQCAVRPIQKPWVPFHQRGSLLCARKVIAEYIVGDTRSRTSFFCDSRFRRRVPTSDKFLFLPRWAVDDSLKTLTPLAPRFRYSSSFFLFHFLSRYFRSVATLIIGHSACCTPFSTKTKCPVIFVLSHEW